MRLTALVILTVVAGVMVYAGLKRGTGTASRAPVRAPMTAPQGSGAGSVALPSAGGAVQDLVELADEGVVTGVDPETGRLRYRMAYDALDPQERGVFRLTRPRAWIYQREQVFEITAESGRLLWPARDREPESGHLEGNVTIRVLPRTEDNDSVPDASDSTRPAITLRTPSLSFDTTFGEARSNDQVRIEGPGLAVDGEGLTVRVSEDRARPIAFLRVERGGRFAYDPEKADERTSASLTSDRNEGTGRTGAHEPVLSFYRASVGGGVVFRMGQRVLEGEEVLAWARLSDGRLVADSFTPLEDRQPSDRETGAERTDRSRDPIDMTWSGPLELRAVLDEPSELARNDAFVRVQSPSGRAVVARDEAGGGSVRCVTLDYGATRRELVLYGVGPIGVTLTAPELLELIAGRAEIDLTSGIGAVPGPGLARALGQTAPTETDADAAEPPERVREIRWHDRADFRLRVPPDGSERTEDFRPEEVSFTGRVEARDGDAGLGGQFVRLLLDEPRVEGSRSIALRRLVAEGSAYAHDADGGRIEAESLDVLFTENESSSQPIPVIATAQGDVSALREGDSMRAGMLEARLVEDASGRIVIDSLEGRLGVEVRSEREAETGREVLEARADRLNARDRIAVVELIGEPASVSRSASGESASVSGGSMRLTTDERARSLSVFGPGGATYSSRRAETGGYDRVQVDWTEGMVYDDAAGRAEAIGAVVASADLGELERHVVRAARLTLTLTEPSPESDRALRTALAEGDDTTPAKVELRRYARSEEPNAIPVLEGLAYLEGPSVEINAPDRTLAVTGAGLLLLEDRRPAQPTQRQDSEVLIAGGARGTTLMTWTGALQFDHAAGRGELRDGVTVKHRHPGDDRMMEIQSERLEARFDSNETGSGEGALSLVSIEADGGVLALHGDRQLVCDRLTYDRALGLVKAFAAPGNRVTVVDEAKGQHFVADAVELDLTNDSLRAIGGSTLTPVP